MTVPEHPEVARCLATGYPHPLRPEVTCCDCGKSMNYDDSFNWDGDIICEMCLKERIDENFNISEIAGALGIHHAMAIE